MERMEKGKKHVTNGISQFALTKQTLNNLSQYDITPVAKLVLLYLTDCYNPKNAEVFPKQKTIALKLGVSERSITRAIQELFKAGLILIERKSSNRYFLRLKNDFGAAGSKIFSQNNLSDATCKNVTLQTDNLSDPHVHEQTKEQKRQQESDFEDFVCCFGKKNAESDDKNPENDKLLLKALENKPWIKNKVAYLNTIKRSGNVEMLIKEGKELFNAEKHNRTMLKLTELNTKRRELDAELAEPPTKTFIELKKVLLFRASKQ